MAISLEKSVYDKERYLKIRDSKLEYQKEYYLKNKDEINEYKKSHHLKNKEKLNLISKNYYENNKDKMKSDFKNYYQINSDNIKNYQKKWCEENKERLNEKNSLRRKNDHTFRIKLYTRSSFYQSFKRQLKIKKKRFFSYTGIHFDKYIEHFKQSELWDDFCNGENIHIDHIIPISAYDFTDENEIKKCWQLENLRLLNGKENILKKDKIDFDLIEKYNISHLLPKEFLK